jgi:hypothetical protein
VRTCGSDVTIISNPTCTALRVLGVAGNNRFDLLPDVPTVAETVPGCRHYPHDFHGHRCTYIAAESEKWAKVANNRHRRRQPAVSAMGIVLTMLLCSANASVPVA